MEEIQKVFDDLNAPSAKKLFAVLRSRGSVASWKTVDEFVKKQSVRQVQAPRYGFTGKISADSIGDRWFADLIDFTAAPSDGGHSVGLHPTISGFRYILAVQDVFSRFLYCEPLRTKTPLDVANAFADIATHAGYRPRSVTTDNGAEFGEPFRKILEDQGIETQQKDKFDVNAISTLDNAIGSFKKALARNCRSNRTDNWAGIVARTVAGQNRIPNDDYLDGVAPEKVSTSPELISYLQQKNAGFEAHNTHQSDKRKEKLESTGHFRDMIAAGKFTRGFKPRWSAEIHTVAGVRGAYVTDETGKETLSKFAQAVPGDSTTDGGPVGIERGGSKQTEFKQRTVLESLKKEAVAFLSYKDNPPTLSELAVYLNRFGFADKARQAGLNMKSATAAFLRVDPEIF